jgi:uncharacterized membrane protein YtjA (UPF0391 family)
MTTMAHSLERPMESGARGTSIARSLGAAERVRRRGSVMLELAITLFVIAIVAAILGFGGIAGSAAALAKLLFFIFLILAITSFAFDRRAI